MVLLLVSVFKMLDVMVVRKQGRLRYDWQLFPSEAAIQRLIR